MFQRFVKSFLEVCQIWIKGLKPVLIGSLIFLGISIPLYFILYLIVLFLTYINFPAALIALDTIVGVTSILVFSIYNVFNFFTKCD